MGKRRRVVRGRGFWSSVKNVAGKAWDGAKGAVGDVAKVAAQKGAEALRDKVTGGKRCGKCKRLHKRCKGAGVRKRTRC